MLSSNRPYLLFPSEFNFEKLYFNFKIKVFHVFTPFRDVTHIFKQYYCYLVKCVYLKKQMKNTIERVGKFRIISVNVPRIKQLIINSKFVYLESCLKY